MNWTYNPEEIDYSISLEEKEIEVSEEETEEESLYNNTLEIGNYTFVNVPFTISRANNSISLLRVSVSDLLGNDGSEKRQNRFIKETIKCHYYALSKEALEDAKSAKLGTFHIEIDNKDVVDYVETPNLSELDDSIFKTKAISGDYKLESLSYKKTIDPNLYDVTMTFVGTKDYDSITETEEGEEGEEVITFDTIFDYFNPLNNPNIEVHLSCSLITFDGYLSDLSNDSLTAMGKECKLLDVLITDTYRQTTVNMYNPETGSYEMFSIENILDWITYILYYYRNSIQFTGYIKGDLCANSFFDLIGVSQSLFIDKNIWEIILQISQALGTFMCVKENQIVFSTGALKPSYFADNDVVVSIPSNHIESKKVSMKAQKYYDGVKLTGQFEIMDSNNGLAINVTANNTQQQANFGANYTTMEQIENTDDTESPAYSLDFVHNAPDGMNCTISFEQLTFIEGTVPSELDIGEYFGSIVVTVRPDAAPHGISINLGVVESEEVDAVTAHEFIVPLLSDYEHIAGKGYVHLFGDQESLKKVTFTATVYSFGEDTLLENYYENNSDADYVYTHSSNLIQNSDITSLDYFCEYLLYLENSKMKQISIVLNKVYDLYPGDIIAIPVTSTENRNCTVESVEIIYRNDDFTTNITCYEKPVLP